MTKHLYQRTITKNGKKIKAWYYWFYDENGKQVRKSCGQNGKPCLLKRDAESFLESLKEEEASKKKHIDLTFNEFCVDFYDENSVFLRKQAARGFHYQKNTIKQKKGYLEKFLEKFGDNSVQDLTVGDVEDWLINLPGSNSGKNNLLSVIDEIESELYAKDLIEKKIHVKHFKRNTVQKGILSLSEMTMLFPDNYEDLTRLWKIRTSDTQVDSYAFAVMVYTLFTTGMRSSEIRALQWNQFIRPDAILINAMVDSNNERVNRLKKWTDENKKWRVTILPDKTVDMIDMLRRLRNPNPEDYVFTYNGNPITTWFLLQHFKSTLNDNGINCKERNITIHSLRFTYNSLMRGEISGDDLRLMVGHTSERMTDYYDKSKAIEHLDSLLQNKNTLNSVFN